MSQPYECSLRNDPIHTQPAPLVGAAIAHDNRVRVPDFSAAARANIEETGGSWGDALGALLIGAHTPWTLLKRCLDGAEADRVQGWIDYVDALVAELERIRRGGAKQ